MISLKHWNDEEALALIDNSLEDYNQDDLIPIIENLADRLRALLERESLQGETESKMIEESEALHRREDIVYQTVTTNAHGIQKQLSTLESLYTHALLGISPDALEEANNQAALIHKLLNDIHDQEVE